MQFFLEHPVDIAELTTAEVAYINTILFGAKAAARLPRLMDWLAECGSPQKTTENQPVIEALHVLSMASEK